ncbi:Hypothetical predicted protein [Pelobates cultripes]|uniref:Uncharacterized protein n=1 Tax=Pelobates cultripes TaxID=61616 RepID=A0AAD1SUJ6_PELCU|nr:Hypothetical predicted protein [Pelobates cultripes]
MPTSTQCNVLLRVHYFHIKEIIMRSCRNKPDPHEEYRTVQIMVDLSTATLRRRKAFQPITEELREQGIWYSWGYPTKILVTKDVRTKMISTLVEDMQMLKEWGLCLHGLQVQPYTIFLL